ncbi:type VI immunity family protein [Cupriavidus sp. SW-Y-13]|uniref:type VI immunity family protein n=1 Tax=Cupriavidus sp. SW-Y-13 TaxID=2653854 RepID=UPI001365ED4D|nr:type VI immunity family protein [Cupriavidus sp. SW-Y-13]
MTSFSPLAPTEAIERYSHELTFRDPSDSNRIVIRPALIGTLFFERGSQPMVRRGLLDCTDRFLTMFSQNLFGEFDGKSRYSKRTKNGVESIRRSIVSTQPNGRVHFALSDVTEFDSAPEFLIEMLTGQELLENRYGVLSHLKFVLPWSFAENTEGIDKFHELMTFCCKALPIRGGYGGLSSVLPYDFDRHLPMEYQLSRRFQGLEVDAWALAEAYDYQDNHIKSTNWYTVLGDPLLEKLGSEADVRAALCREDILMERHGQCLVIRAGDYPLLGAPEEGPLEPYIFVNRVIRPLRKPLRGSMHSYMEGVERFGEEESRRWVARFDEPEGPIDDSTPQPSRGASALPFQTCPRSGRWVANHLGNRIAQVKAGDPMPGPERSDVGNQVVWYFVRDIE